MYSPAAIENAPASKPASPANAMVVLAAPEPAKPITPRAVGHQAVVDAEHRGPQGAGAVTSVPALDFPDSAGVGRPEPGEDPGVRALVDGHRRCRVRVALREAGVGVLGSLEIGQH